MLYLMVIFRNLDVYCVHFTEYSFFLGIQSGIRSVLSEKQNIQFAESGHAATQSSYNEPSAVIGLNVDDTSTSQCESELVVPRSQLPGFVNARIIHQQRSQLESDYNAVTAAMLQLPTLLQTAIDRLPVTSGTAVATRDGSQTPVPSSKESDSNSASCNSQIDAGKITTDFPQQLAGDVGKKTTIFPQRLAGNVNPLSLKAVKNPVIDANVKTSVSKVPSQQNVKASSSVRDTSSNRTRVENVPDDDFVCRFNDSSDDQGTCPWWRMNFVRGETFTEKPPSTLGILEGEDDDCVFVCDIADAEKTVKPTRRATKGIN